MKLSKNQLKKIIKEEIQNAISEAPATGTISSADSAVANKKLRAIMMSPTHKAYEKAWKLFFDSMKDLRKSPYSEEKAIWLSKELASLSKDLEIHKAKFPALEQKYKRVQMLGKMLANALTPKLPKIPKAQ